MYHGQDESSLGIQFKIRKSCYLNNEEKIIDKIWHQVIIWKYIQQVKW
jgi:hypothetical protein